MKEKIRAILAKHKQVLAEDQFWCGHALNAHLKKMFDELEVVVSAEKSVK